MTKNSRVLGLAVIGAIVLLSVIIVGRDLFLRTAKTINCDDGPRKIIDIRDFTTQYWAYSVEFEAKLSDKASLTSKVDPKQFQQLSESLQQANEFRKYLVAGYNSCAVSKAQYLQFGAKFQTLDSLSRQIDAIVGKPQLSENDKTQLALLIERYIAQTQQLTAEAK
jgi:hypothetical protein